MLANNFMYVTAEESSPLLLEMLRNSSACRFYVMGGGQILDMSKFMGFASSIYICTVFHFRRNLSAVAV